MVGRKPKLKRKLQSDDGIHEKGERRVKKKKRGQKEKMKHSCSRGDTIARESSG